MKRILYTLVVLAAAAALLVSCNKENPSDASYLDGNLITFVTKAPMTRATGVAEETTATLTSFNVLATTGSGTEANAWTAEFTKNNDKYTGGMVWPATDPGYHFYASNATMSFAASGSTIVVNDSNKDVVAAYLATPTFQSSNLLTFNHILCQVGTVTVKAPAGYTVSNIKISLQPIYGGTFNMKSSAWTPGSPSSAYYILGTAASGVDITASSGVYTSNDNDLWLVPGTYVLTATYTMKKGTTFTQDFTKTSTVALVMGKNNNLGLNSNQDPNIPVPEDITDIEFTVVVTPWEDNDIPFNF